MEEIVLWYDEITEYHILKYVKRFYFQLYILLCVTKFSILFFNHTSTKYSFLHCTFKKAKNKCKNNNLHISPLFYLVSFFFNTIIYEAQVSLVRCYKWSVHSANQFYYSNKCLFDSLLNIVLRLSPFTHTRTHIHTRERT